MTGSTFEAVIDSPVGPLRLHADQHGNLISVRFILPADPVPAITAPRRIPPDLVCAVNQLEEYFAGHRRAFSVPVALHGTEFHQAAWRALARIPYGSTCSYSAQAAMVDNPGAARAVGAANHRNPLPIVLPCHRVIAADGTLGGFGAGIARKQWLLAHERDTVATDPRATLPAEMSRALQLPLIPLPR